MIPSDSQIRADAEFLGFTDQDTAKILTHAQRARTGSTDRDGFKGTHGAAGSRAAGISDPTGTMACDDEPPTPEVEKQHTLLFDMLTKSAASKRAVRNTLDRLGGVQEWHKPAGHTSTPCKSVGCDDPGERRGWCDACRKWVERNPTFDGVEPATVPADVIEKRTQRRERVS